MKIFSAAIMICLGQQIAAQQRLSNIGEEFINKIDWNSLPRHPRLFANDTRIDFIKIQKDKISELLLFILKKDAENKLLADKIIYPNGISNMSTSRNVQGRIFSLAFASAETKPNIAKQIVERATKNTPFAEPAYSPDGAFAEGSSDEPEQIYTKHVWPNSANCKVKFIIFKPTNNNLRLGQGIKTLPHYELIFYKKNNLVVSNGHVEIVKLEDPKNGPIMYLKLNQQKI
ncbi:MAG: hypothetical protein LH615_13750 [Ferruginibacter sp.]|nr:hypothetical protein [Ferruginibacter sp.]